MKTQRKHSIQHEVIIVFGVLLLGIGTGTAWWSWRKATPVTVTQQPIPSQVNKSPTFTIPEGNQAEIQKLPVAKIPETAVPSPTIQLQPQAYWLAVEGQQIRLIPQVITVEKGASQEVALTAALNNLLETPHTHSFSSTIPAGTKLLSLRVTKAGISVNLSREFSSGGGSTSMTYRVAQILYTASSINPKANVFISIEGKLLNENYPLGGEGLVLSSPITRQQFAKDFSIS